MVYKLLRVGFMLMVALSIGAANAQTKKPSQNATRFADSGATQQVLFGDYKGVRVDMTADEVHNKLGKPGMKVDDTEFYVFNERETVQVAYEKGKVIGISVDYLGGIGAPDYRNVVGPDITTRPDGSMYKLVRYDRLGFWVSYHKSANTPVTMVSVTIQKMM